MKHFKHVVALLLPLSSAASGFLSLPIMRSSRFGSAILAALTLACSAPGLAESPDLKDVDSEVVALVQELRDLPGDEGWAKCTLCKEVSKIGAERRSEIYDRLHELGSAAVPALARMLQSSLQNSDEDLTNTILWILGSPSITSDLTGHPSARRDQKKDVSAALPALMLALDDPKLKTARMWAPGLIGTIGPKAAVAVPKLVALLDDGEWVFRGSACNGLIGVDPLPALRQQVRSDPNPAKRQFAQHAVASIESNCFGADVSEIDATAQIHEHSSWGPPCDAPPYGDTPAAYNAFARPYVSISLGPVKRLLQDVCVAKTNPEHISPRRRLELSDEDIDTLGTVALAEKQLAAIVKPPPCPESHGVAIEGIVCRKIEKGPGELFLCFQPDGSCLRISATPSTPINSLSECYQLAAFLSENGPYPFSPGARFVVPGAGAWYECRTETVYDVLKEKLGSVPGL